MSSLNTMSTKTTSTPPISKSRSIAWMVWAVASIFYAYQYILRVMPNIMMSDILQQFNIDAGTFGQFSGVYYLGYSLLHLPIGILLDRFGPRNILPICILLTVLGLLPLVVAEHWIYPLLGRVLIGIGSSAAILGTFKIIRLTFSEQRFTRMLSFSVMIGLVGAIYGGAPLHYLCCQFSHKTVILLLMGFGLFMSAFTYWMVPRIETSQKFAVLSNVKQVLRSPKVLGICLLAGLMVGPLEGFADVWGKEFLSVVYGLEGNIAASLTSTVFMGMCFGAPVLSLIAEKTKSPVATIIGSGIIMALGFFGLLTYQLSVPVMGVMFFIVGICCSYQIIAIYRASTYVSEENVGLTTALANMIIMIFGYVFHSVMGWIINSLGGPKDPIAFKFGIVVIPIALTIAAIGLLILAFLERKSRGISVNDPVNEITQGERA